MIAKEFLLLLRDRQSLVVLFAMPLVLVVTVSAALRDVYLGLTGSGLEVAVVDRDDSPASRRYLERLEAQAGCDFQAVPARALTAASPGAGGGTGGSADGGADGDGPSASPIPDGFQALVSVPPGFGAELEALAEGRGRGFSTPLAYVYDPALEKVYEQLLVAGLGSALEQSLLGHLTDLLAARGLLPEGAATDVDPAELNLAAPDTGAQVTLPTPLQHTVPAWSLFAMFFIALPLSASLLAERRSGLLRRLRTYPVRPVQLLAAKLLPHWLVNLAQFGLLLVVGAALAGPLDVPALSLGAHPWVLAPVAACVALAATSFGLAVAVVARTDNQASALAAFLTVLMAVSGGVMIPVFVMPGPMQLVAQASPLFWAHQACQDVFLRGADLVDVLPWLLRILAFAAACLGLGAWRFRWE